MTATIAPSPRMGETLRADRALRLQDYCQALSWYLGLPDEIVDRIVLLENSGSDLSPFADLAAKLGSRKQLELIAISPDAPPERGKGYAETLMIEEGLSRTRLLGERSPFWKVTGRLRVLNLAELIDSAPRHFDLYCDLRDVPLIGETLGGNRWMETRLFAATPAAYRRLFHGQGDRDYVIEKGFYPLVRSAMAEAQLAIYPRFRRQPVIAGVSAYSGADYRSPSYRAKEAIRKVGRRIAPGLWL